MIKEILITSLTGRGSVVMKDRAYKGYWLDTTNWGQVQGTHQTYSFPDQVGESIASTTIEKRPLSIIGWVVEGGTKDMRQRCDFLNSFFSPVEDYTLEYEGKKIVFRPDASIQYPPDPLHNNELVRKFMLTGTIAYPLFTDKTDTAAAFDSTGKLFRFPNSFGRAAPVVFGTRSTTYSVEVNNPGGFTTWITAKFTFSGAVEDPEIKNFTTGEVLRVKRPFTRGEVLEISTKDGSKYMRLTTAEGHVENILKNWDFRTDWVHLAPGRNMLALGCKDLEQRANMSVTVFFTPVYLEVE